ncbi:hypothetical protein SVIOM342S_00863 [Streptomyces violaceorubidus]
MAGLPGLLPHLGGRRLRAEFWQLEFWLDGTGEQAFRAAEESVGAVLDASPARAVVALSDSLYYDEVCEEGGRPRLPAGPLPTAARRHRLVRPGRRCRHPGGAHGHPEPLNASRAPRSAAPRPAPSSGRPPAGPRTIGA